MVKYISRKKPNTVPDTASHFKTGQWVQVVSPSNQEIDQLAADLGVEASLLHDATDEDEMPRFEIEDDKAYLYTRFAWKSSGGNIQTAPILFVIGDTCFISLSTQAFPALESVLSTHESLVTSSPKHLLLPALNVALQSYSSQLATIGRQIRTARNSLRDEKFSNRHFVRFVELEDILNDFLSELVPTNSILVNMLAGRKMLRYGEDDRDVLEDLQLEAAQLIEESKSYLKTIVNIREAYSNIMTNNLNRQIKILTILTIVLTVPTMVGSFFGMNVIVPLSNNPWAFYAICGITVSFVILVMYLLKRKDWF